MSRTFPTAHFQIAVCLGFKESIGLTNQTKMSNTFSCEYKTISSQGCSFETEANSNSEMGYCLTLSSPIISAVMESTVTSMTELPLPMTNAAAYTASRAEMV